MCCVSDCVCELFGETNTVVVDATSEVVTNGFVVEHDVEQEEELEVEGMGAIETAVFVVGDECSQ